MSLRTRFILTLGFGGAFFLFVITVLVFYRMEVVMESQLKQQFQSDIQHRIAGLNKLFSERTTRFQSIAKLPMFKSMRFHELSLNQAALKNDIRQMELYGLDLINQDDALSKILYIDSNGSEVFRVERSGIKSHLSDRSQDVVVQKMLTMGDVEYSVTHEKVNDKINDIIWWIPVYVSIGKISGIIGFSVEYNYVLNSVSKLVISESESVCLIDAQGNMLLSSKHKNACERNDDLWQISEKMNLPGLYSTLIFSANPDAFLSEVKEIRTIVFGVILPLVTIIGLAFALLFSNYFVGAIRQLVKAARIMGGGKVPEPIVISRDDELGELATEMNRSAKLIEAARQELEERNRGAEAKHRSNLQAIMNYSPAVIYVKDIDGRYMFVNYKFEKLYSVIQKDIIGKKDNDIFQGDTAANFDLDNSSVLESGHAQESEEIISQDDGPHTYVSIRFPLFDSTEKIYAACCISTDITDRKQQEERLRRSLKMDALGKLTGGIAHDYNNMLGIILGYAELLASQLGDQPKFVKYVDEIQHAGKRGAKLTQKLLSFARQKSANAESIIINNVLRDDRHMLEKTLTVRIILSFDLDDDLWSVYLDSGDLEDAIINLSINAMHAMQKGGQLTLQTRNEKVDKKYAERFDLQAGEYVVFTVTDTGCGMDNEMLDKIFDPFFTTKGQAGTGLGLSQVYGFVESNGGRIKVYSELEKGSSFSLYFPRHYESGEELSLDKDNVKQDVSGYETILIVDDELALLGLASEILSQHGYKVICAESAKQALEVLDDESIDLLFSDVIMPEVDGYQLAAIVREKYPAVKIQLVSGFHDVSQVSGPDVILQNNLIHKPYDAQEVLKKITNLLSA